jgi:RES domain-containing protein
LKALDKLDAVVYRALSIKYYKAAFSAKGARLNAGRFNRPGISALYVALEPDTAIMEYYQSDPPRPCVLVPAYMEVKALVDIRGKLGRWRQDWRAWESDWRAARDAHIGGDLKADCESWRCGDDAINRNFSGIIFPSRRRPGGANVALFVEDAPAGGLHLRVMDPLNEILAAHPTKIA